GVERGPGRRQTVFKRPLLRGVEFHQHAAATRRPVIAVGIELAARRTGTGTGVGLEHFAGLRVDYHQAVAWPGATAEIAPILPQGAAVGAGEFFQRVTRDEIAGKGIDLADLPLARPPDKTFGVERDVADRGRVRDLRHLPRNALELAGFRVEAIDV